MGIKKCPSINNYADILRKRVNIIYNAMSETSWLPRAFGDIFVVRSAEQVSA